jgi:hypothetical protein
MNTPIFIHSKIVDKWIRLAGYHRSWPTYGADVIEKVLKHYAVIPQGYMYRGFHVDTEMVEFRLPTYADLRVPSRIDRIKQWIIKKLS